MCADRSSQWRGVVSLLKWLFDDNFLRFWSPWKICKLCFSCTILCENTHTHTCTHVHRHPHFSTVTHWQIKVTCSTPHHTYSSCSDITWWVMHPKLCVCVCVVMWDMRACTYAHSRMKQQHCVCVFLLPMCACNRRWGYVFIPVSLYVFHPSLLPLIFPSLLCLFTFSTSTPSLF